ERQAAASKVAAEMADAQQDSALNALQQAAAMAGPPSSQGLVFKLVSAAGDSTAAVMKAPVDNKPVIFSAGKADETGFTPAVEVPAAVLQDISAGGKPVVLVISFISDAMVTVLDLASSPPSPKMASKPLSITLFDSEGNPLSKGTKLKVPILLTLQQKASAGTTCAFWDEEAGAWSVEGVKRVQFSPGESASSTGPLVCATSHLTIFAAVTGWLDVASQRLVCSNAAGIFSAGGAQALLRFSKASQTPVILLWVLLAFHVLCFLVAAGADYLESVKSEEEQKEPTRTETKARRKYTCLGIEVGGFASASIDYIKCLPEALEEMVRDSIKSLGKEVGRFPSAITDYMRSLPEAPEKMVRESIKRVQAAKMGLCEESLKLVVQKDEDIKLLPELKKRCGSREWTSQRINEDEDLAKKGMMETNWLGRVVMLLKAGHPWMLVLQSSIVRSHMVRFALIFCKMTGTAAAIALFYESSGKTISYDSPDPDACTSKDDLMTKLIRLMTVGLASALMVDLVAPLLFILRPQQTYSASSLSKNTAKMKVVFWILFVIYNCLALYIVMVFLANVSDADGNDWFVSVMFSLLKGFFLAPLGTAFVLGTLVTIEDLHKLTECARDGEWDLVFEMLDKSPMLLNERPPGFDYAVLHLAVIHDNLEVVSTLINRYHADPDLPSRYGEKALEIAKNLGHKDLYRILSQREGTDQTTRMRSICTVATLGTDHKQTTSLHNQPPPPQPPPPPAVFTFFGS
ncbi:unnamed protein product, partial [Polarella glacialis]